MIMRGLRLLLVTCAGMTVSALPDSDPGAATSGLTFVPALQFAATICANLTVRAPACSVSWVAC